MSWSEISGKSTKKQRQTLYRSFKSKEEWQEYVSYMTMRQADNQIALFEEYRQQLINEKKERQREYQKQYKIRLRDWAAAYLASKNGETK